MNWTATQAPRAYTCGKCSGMFPSFDALQRHVDEMKHYRCTARFCQKDFDSRQALVAHRSVCRPPPPPPLVTNDSPYPTAPISVDISVRRQRVAQLSKRPSSYSPEGKNRFIYMDTDNIIFSMLNSPHLHPLVGAQFSNALRLHFDKFTQRVCNSTSGASSPNVKMMSASYYGAAQVLAQSLVRFGWKVVKREGVSEMDLHTLIHNNRDERNDVDNRRCTLVLVTGDAKTNRLGTSFRSIAQQYLDNHWNVEVHAWAHSVHEGFIQLMEQHPATFMVKLIDETDDISHLVYAGSYNPWQQAQQFAPIPQSLPSPVFHSQPPSPAHSIMSEFDFDTSAPAVLRSRLHQQEQLTTELQIENTTLKDKIRLLEGQLAAERVAHQQLIDRIAEERRQQESRVTAPWVVQARAVRST